MRAEGAGGAGGEWMYIGNEICGSSQGAEVVREL